jgi:hypothetical protein
MPSNIMRILEWENPNTSRKEHRERKRAARHARLEKILHLKREQEVRKHFFF